MTVAPRLGTLAEDRQRLTVEGFPDEVGDHPAVVELAVRTVGVEDADDAHVQLVDAVEVHGQGFGVALALVVASPRTVRIYVAEVVLGLGVNLGVAIHLGGGCLQEGGALLERKLEHMARAFGVHAQGGDAVGVVAHRAGGAGHVEDGVNRPFLWQGLDDVVLDELEAAARQQGGDVVAAAGEQIIDAHDVVAGVEQGLAKVGADEAGATRNKDVQAAIS